MSSLTCPICLDVLHRPVTVPCGHSYCLQCVLQYWDTEGDTEGRQQGPRCPQCRQRFHPRPRLAVNTVLAQLADSVRENKQRGGALEECVCPKRTCETSQHSLDLRTHQRNVSEDRRCDELLVADGHFLHREVLTTLRNTEQLLKHLLCLMEPTGSELQTSNQRQQGVPGSTQNQQGQTLNHQGQTQNHQGQTQNQQGQTLNHQGQTQNQQGQTQNQQGQTQNQQGQTQNQQGQTQNQQGQTLNHQGQTQNQQGQTLNHQGQTQNQQGQTQNQQGQTQNQQGQTQNQQGQTQNHQGQTQNQQGQTQNQQGQTLNHQGQTQNHQGQTQNQQGQTQNHKGQTQNQQGQTQNQQGQTQNQQGQTQNQQGQTQNQQGPPGQTQDQQGPPGQTQSQQGHSAESQNQQGPPGQTQNQQGPPGQTQNQQGPSEKTENHQEHSGQTQPETSTTQNRQGHANSSHSPRFWTNISSPVSEFWLKRQTLLTEEWPHLPVAAPREPHPHTREELLQYSRSVSLDPHTANSRVRLSRANTRATLSRDSQPYGEHPKRFMDCTQVLSEESLSGRSYLEVEWSGWGFYLALASKKIPRSGEESRFGQGERSWALHCEKTGYELLHRGVLRSLSGPRSSRLAVFLDQAAGRLSFYSLSPHSLHLLHTTSTGPGPAEPLAVGVRLYSVGDYVEFCQRH